MKQGVCVLPLKGMSVRIHVYGDCPRYHQCQVEAYGRVALAGGRMGAGGSLQPPASSGVGWDWLCSTLWLYV
jgi:hypothetical protein